MTFILAFGVKGRALRYRSLHSAWNICLSVSCLTRKQKDFMSQLVYFRSETRRPTIAKPIPMTIGKVNGSCKIKTENVTVTTGTK